MDIDTLCIQQFINTFLDYCKYKSELYNILNVFYKPVFEDAMYKKERLEVRMYMTGSGDAGMEYVYNEKMESYYNDIGETINNIQNLYLK